MDELWVWVMWGAAALAQGLAVCYFFGYYGRPGSRDCVLMTVATLAVAAALGALMLLPVDTFIVSNLGDILDNPELELEGRLREIGLRTQAVQYASYGLWAGSAAVAFLVVPFVYFFHEEEELYGFEERRTGALTCAALKYVVLLLVVVGALLGVALGVQPGLSLDDLVTDFAWIAKWAQVSAPVAEAFNFLMVGLGCVGLLSWVCYTSVGLAYMPIDILRGQRHVDLLRATIEERQSLLGNRYDQIRDKARRHGAKSLSRRERRDKEVSEQSALRLQSDRAHLDRSQTALNALLNRCPLLRYVVGLVLLLLSLLLLEAAIVSAIDTTLNHTGWMRGFVLTEGELEYLNALSLALTWSCGAAPAIEVYAAAAQFGGLAILTLHIVSSTMYGMFTVGMCGIGRLKPHRTWPQSLLVAAFVLVFTLWGALLTVPALAPQFFTYGCQQQPGAEPTDPMLDCTRSAPQPYCIDTQFSLVSAYMRLSLPPLGIFIFGVGWAFVGMTLLAFGSAILMLSRFGACKRSFSNTISMCCQQWPPAAPAPPPRTTSPTTMIGKVFQRRALFSSVLH